MGGSTARSAAARARGLPRRGARARALGRAPGRTGKLAIRPLERPHVPGMARDPSRKLRAMPKALYFANTDWYLWNFRLPLLASVRDRGWEVVLVAPPGPWLPKLAAEGFKCIAFPLERHGLHPFAELGAVMRLAR